MATSVPEKRVNCGWGLSQSPLFDLPDGDCDSKKVFVDILQCYQLTSCTLDADVCQLMTVEPKFLRGLLRD